MQRNLHVVMFYWSVFCIPEVRQEAVQQALAQAMQNRHKPSLPMPSKRTSVMARSPDRDRHDSGKLSLMCTEFSKIVPPISIWFMSVTIYAEIYNEHARAENKIKLFSLRWCPTSFLSFCTWPPQWKLHQHWIRRCDVEGQNVMRFSIWLPCDVLVGICKGHHIYLRIETCYIVVA